MYAEGYPLFVHVCRFVVELFAEFGHVYSEWAEGLADGGAWAGGAGGDAEFDVTDEGHGFVMLVMLLTAVNCLFGEVFYRAMCSR